MTAEPPLRPAPLSTEAFRDVAGRFATGVTVVTTAGDGTVHGMTANGFATVSLDPLLALVSVDRAAGMHDLLDRTGVFAVSVLAAHQEDLSRWFASRRRGQGAGQFEGVACAASPASGSPVIQGCLAWFDCRIAAAHQAGDHTLFVGEVRAMGAERDADPLVFFRGGYYSVPNSRSPKSPRPGTM